MANLSDLAQPPINAPIGSGLASMARNTINLRKQYQAYKIEANSNGEEALPFEQWAATQANG